MVVATAVNESALVVQFSEGSLTGQQGVTQPQALVVFTMRPQAINLCKCLFVVGQV